MPQPTLSPEQIAALRERAVRCADGHAAAEDNLNRRRRERDALMRVMHEAGISWAEIGRTFSVTPQAAMYASGVRTRTGRGPSVK